MSQLLLKGTLVVLSGILALTTTACGNNNPVIGESEAANPLPASAAPIESPTPVPSASPEPQTAPDFYQQALDTATGATLLGEQALVRSDWSLAATRWQEAIGLLKAVPISSAQYEIAQKKLIEYQGYLTLTQAKAAPPPEPSCANNTNPQFFFAPIKQRLGGIPVIEVNFNDKYSFEMLVDTGASRTLITPAMAATLELPVVGEAVVTVADGAVAALPVTVLKSQEIDGRILREMPVIVTSPAMDMGLLGQDFFKGYDLIIKENIIEFRRQSGVKATTKTTSSKACRVDTNPAFFSAPIKRKENGRPIIEVTFHDQYTFEMVFDTGASDTLVTRSMAAQLKLPLIGISQVMVADGSVVTLPVALVESQKIDSRLKTDMPVFVAPPAKTIGLLGQDFFEGYNVTIQENVIEFRRQRYSE